MSHKEAQFYWGNTESLLDIKHDSRCQDYKDEKNNENNVIPAFKKISVQ